MTKRGVATAVSLLVFLSVAAGQAAAQALTQADLDRLQRVARDELASTRTPGAAIAVVRDGKLVLAKGVGVANIETGALVTPDMLFRLGSTTKMLTAALVVGLAEDGRLKLDVPIGTYVPDLPPRLSQATLHQLMSHTSGLRDFATMFGLHDDAALGQTVKTLTDDFFFTAPGDVYSYANPGFWTAGFVAEVVAGKPYADAMKERLFDPLGMKRSTLRPTLAMTYPLAQGHEQSGAAAPTIIRPAADNAGNWPAGSVFTSVEDLARFVTAFVSNGVIDGKQAFPPGVVARMSMPSVAIPGARAASYGYGLEVSTDRGVRMLTHGGSRSGYGSSIAMAPDRRTAVIILTNRTGSGLPQTARAAMDLALGRDAAPELPVPAAVPMTAAEMSRYTGVYSQTAMPVAELLIKDDTLAIRQGNSTSAVVKLGERRFGVLLAGAARPQEFFLVPGADGRSLYLFRGGRAYRRQ